MTAVKRKVGRPISNVQSAQTTWTMLKEAEKKAKAEQSAIRERDTRRFLSRCIPSGSTKGGELCPCRHLASACRAGLDNSQ